MRNLRIAEAEEEEKAGAEEGELGGGAPGRGSWEAGGSFAQFRRKVSLFDEVYDERITMVHSPFP